ncbi:MAG: DUF2232 domain-containing protein [Gammaproteobacteria bacterium]
MRGRTQAIGIAAGFAVLSLIFPLLSIVSAAVVALVALRLGPAPGMLLVAVSTLVALALTLLVSDMTYAMPAILSLVLLLVLTWIASVVLRYTRSLSMAITALTFIGMVIIIVFHLVVGDPLTWWQSHFDDFFAQATESMMADQKMVFEQNLETWAAIMTGFVTMAFLLNVIFALFIGRAWQAMLYNPGGFREEFHALQFGKKYAIFALVIASVALIPDTTIAMICKDILMVLMMVYVLQGIAVVHSIVAQKGLHWVWLVGLYLLVLMLSQLVAITGYIDTWMNFRRRVTSAV